VRDSVLADAYDSYADQLYVYCRFLLREPADVVDAVEATFLVAAERLAGLREPGQLRPWLYAIARNECVRRIKSGQAAAAAGSVFGQEGDGRPDHALLRAALHGLGPRERDVIGMVWHGLDIPEVALVLGISRDSAFALFSQARDQFEASAVALAMARSGRHDCPELRALLSSWDGQLTVPLRGTLTRHIERCAACSKHRRTELRTALLNLTPGALLGAAMTTETLRRAASTTSMLREQILGTAVGHAQAGLAGKGREPRRDSSFGEDGFPKPMETGGRRTRKRAALAAAGTTAAAAAIVAVVVGGQHAGTGSTGEGLAGPTKRSSATVPTTSPTVARTPGRRASPSPSPSASTAAPAPAPSLQPPSPSASPSREPASPSPSPSASSGTLGLSTRQVTVGSGRPGYLTLTARGGPVAWSVSSSASYLTLSQSSGSLKAGQSVTIQISENRRNYAHAQLTVTGGGETQLVTVTGGGETQLVTVTVARPAQSRGGCGHRCQ
jgi:RNA polymerase sigma factor (sigma-70 family)